MDGNGNVQSARVPRVSVALPVYNGENYLAEALESLAGQEFKDFELLIGDNASTDRTQEICERFASEHGWVTYLRSEVNRGAAWNYNRLVAPTRGEYFMWMAHDDIFAPSLIGKAVDVLDNIPSVVLCSTGVQEIDEHGHLIGPWKVSGPRWSKDPAIRFGDALRRPLWHYSFSLIRRPVLVDTRLFGKFIAADGVFLAELALRGNFVEIPEPLFYNRIHSERSTRAHKSSRERMGWWDPDFRGRLVMPGWRLLKEYHRAIRLAPVDRWTKARARLELLGWCVTSAKWLGADLVRAPGQLVSSVR